eukprot:1180900-Prorocentrum_minimum.AAC.1
MYLSSSYAGDGPIRRRTRGNILMTDQLDAGRAGIFSRRTNRTQDARVCSHGGPIGRRTLNGIPAMAALRLPHRTIISLFISPDEKKSREWSTTNSANNEGWARTL